MNLEIDLSDPTSFVFTLHSDENTFPMFNAYFGDRIEFLHRSFLPVCSEVSMTLKSIVNDRKKCKFIRLRRLRKQEKTKPCSFLFTIPLST